MSKKLSYEYVKQYFEENSCELLEREYDNCMIKMKYKCSCGRISKISFNNFKSKHRCSDCGGNEKHSYEYIKQYFKDNNCELLEKEYINNKTNMKYKCECEILLGYSRKDILEYLKKDPNFDNWVKNSSSWHIDHIIPIKAFVENEITNPKIINALDNLRIIHWKENLQKGATFNKNELQSYVQSKGIL